MTDLALAYNSENCPNSYIRDYHDLNQGAGGDTINTCYEVSNSSSPDMFHVKIEDDVPTCPDGHKLLDGDWNRGAKEWECKKFSCGYKNVPRVYICFKEEVTPFNENVDWTPID